MFLLAAFGLTIIMLSILVTAYFTLYGALLFFMGVFFNDYTEAAAGAFVFLTTVAIIAGELLAGAYLLRFV